MTTIDKNKLEIYFEKAFLTTLLEQTVDVGTAEPSGRSASYRHQPDPGTGPCLFSRLYQLAVLSLTNAAKQTSDVTGLQEDDPDFLANVTLWVEIANGYFLSSRVVVDRNLDKVFIFAFNSGRLENVRAERLCRMRTERATYSAHCEGVPCVEAACEQVAHGF